MTQPRDLRRFAMGASLGASVLMLVGKLYAAWITGSDAILSDAAESVVHIFATGIAAVSLWYAGQPPDRQHPYGHGKIAYFSAGFEGALIFAAALSIIWLAVGSLIRGPEVQELGLGLLITGALGLVNLGLGLFLIRVGRQHRELVLIANGKHVLTDMWTSLGVVLGVALVWLTDIVWLDPVVAILAGLHIIYSGGQLLLEAYNGLMDKVDEDDTQMLLACLEHAREEGLIVGFHQLHHRIVGPSVWVEVHLLFPTGASLHDAHARTSLVELRLQERFGEKRVVVTAHMEPADHDRAHPEGYEEIPEGPLTQPPSW